VTAGGIAIVTGGSRGIGAATSVALASQGWDVVVGYQHNADAAERIRALCRQRGRRAIAVQVDVASDTDVVRLFETADGEPGSVGVLVNSAGVVDRAARVDEYSSAEASYITGALLDIAGGR
jgi:NAD(P)-dependent dehydrogenase (short-subunit alcohol dehydrogenase family)